MQLDTMPTMPSDPAHEDAPLVGKVSTMRGEREAFEDRFRHSRMREQMFGVQGEELRIGRYRVLDRIGRGGMGVVYLGQDDELERPVALKLLGLEGELGRARMQREARALGRVNHPNVVVVHEVGEEEGRLYVAMEYVEGRTLRGWLEEQPRSRSEIFEVFEQAAAGLAAAHAAGIVHRDFKPDNVLVGVDGRVRVVDFGLAREPGAALTSEVDGSDVPTDLAVPQLTRTGVFAGTPAYMAPEQFAGTAVDQRTDQFAFCVALHEALFGHRPHEADTLAELAARVIGGESTVDDSARDLGSVHDTLVRGLHTEPQGRFESMDALVASLRGPKPVDSSGRTMTIVLAAVGLLVAVSLGGIVLGVFAYVRVNPSVADRPAVVTIHESALPSDLPLQQGMDELAAGRPQVALPFLERAAELALASGPEFRIGALEQLGEALRAAHRGSGDSSFLHRAQLAYLQVLAEADASGIAGSRAQGWRAILGEIGSEIEGAQDPEAPQGLDTLVFTATGVSMFDGDSGQSLGQSNQGWVRLAEIEVLELRAPGLNSQRIELSDHRSKIMKVVMSPAEGMDQGANGDWVD